MFVDLIISSYDIVLLLKYIVSGKGVANHHYLFSNISYLIIFNKQLCLSHTCMKLVIKYSHPEGAEWRGAPQICRQRQILSFNFESNQNQIGSESKSLRRILYVVEIN